MSFNQLFSKFALIQAHHASLYSKVPELYVYYVRVTLKVFSTSSVLSGSIVLIVLYVLFTLIASFASSKTNLRRRNVSFQIYILIKCFIFNTFKLN